MEEVLIVEDARSAIGGFGGTLKDVPAVELDAKVIAELLARTGIPAENIDEVIMGNVLQAGLDRIQRDRRLSGQACPSRFQRSL